MSEPAKPANRSLVAALWANAALLAVIAVVLAFRASGERLPGFLPAAYGQAGAGFTPPIAGGGGVFIMPAQFSQSVWGVYLLDIDAQTIAAYTYQPGPKRLDLVAARTYRFDRRLQNFNTGVPSPEEVRELVEREQRRPPPAAGSATQP